MTLLSFVNSVSGFRDERGLGGVPTYGRNSVPLQLGHGGSLSDESSSTTFCPHFRQVYVPLPGFSPVLDISTSWKCDTSRQRTQRWTVVALVPGAFQQSDTRNGISAASRRRE